GLLAVSQTRLLITRRNAKRLISSYNYRLRGTGFPYPKEARPPTCLDCSPRCAVRRCVCRLSCCFDWSTQSRTSCSSQTPGLTLALNRRNPGVPYTCQNFADPVEKRA